MKATQASKSAAPSANENKSGGLGVFALAAIVVSSMLGGGIYSLPQKSGY